MSHTHLASYLNDHLAGSTMALELLDHLESGGASDEIKQFASGLHGEISADRRVLEDLMARLQIGQSTLRTASTWFSEKLMALKMRVEDPFDGSLRLLESLDFISVGIEGKRLLWLALGHLSDTNPKLQEPDYKLLVRRAEEQRAAVEAHRLGAARGALQ